MRLSVFFLLGLLSAGLLAEECESLSAPQSLPPATDQQLAVVSLNLWRLRDTHKDAERDEPVSRDVYQARLDAIARYIDKRLHGPALLALQEVENEAILDALSQRLARRGYQYQTIVEGGTDPSGMKVALMYRRDVDVAHSRRLFQNRDYRGHALFSRPPLVVTLREPISLTLVVVHLRSARSLGKHWVREKRQRQAANLAQWVAATDRPLVVAGDFNTTWGDDLFSRSYRRFARAGLFNTWQRLPKEQRYSYRHYCQPQALDHIWISDSLRDRLDDVAVTRGNAGRFQALHRSHGTGPVSDHEAVAIYLKKSAVKASR